MSSPHPLPTAVTSHTLPSSESSNCVAIGLNSSAFSSEGKQIFIFLSLSIFFSFFFYFSLFLLPHLLQWWMDICQISKLSQPHSQLCDYRIRVNARGGNPQLGQEDCLKWSQITYKICQFGEESSSNLACSYTAISSYH